MHQIPVFILVDGSVFLYTITRVYVYDRWVNCDNVLNQLLDLHVWSFDDSFSHIRCFPFLIVQNAFVICRLFKKQDETIEDINGDEVDPAVSSHTETMQSELEVPQDSPTVEVKAEQVSNTSETCSVGLPNEVISNAVAPILERNSNDYEAYGVMGQVAEIAPAEVRKRN